MRDFLRIILVRHFFWISFVFLASLRFLYLFAIQPGNAPDEIGHMLMVVGFAGGKYITLSESMQLTNYPYSVYNPLGYLPSSLALFLGSLCDKSVLHISEPFRFTPLQNLIARLGMQFWTLSFVALFLNLLRGMDFRMKWFLICAIALIPQIIFVQSYVNLDSLGLVAFLYLLWSIKNKREAHFAIANFLIACCKMNFFCMFLISASYLFWEYKSSRTKFFKKSAVLLFLPALVGSLWFFFSYWINTRQYGSFFGFNALSQIYHSSESGGFRIFTISFLNLTLNSAFGRFGWMSLRYPEVIYSIWRILMLPAGFYFLWRSFRHPVDRLSKFIAGTFLGLVVFNFFLHYWASFTNSYQPQGRYIFPAIIVLQVYLVRGLLSEPLTNRRRKIANFICLFMFLSAIAGAKIASKKVDDSQWVASQFLKSSGHRIGQ